ncbi:LysR family transcriptional regulator [Polaromonas eurypsychrophila]|uniref:LysR family transcriptional regulator n=1 Tax=Polaromonas eurypsychrophila TaxID=1614635 RepID=A0A916WIT7_9BURK|nr:LysR family transcriptional regulator [Polaromonas eurypsychrophila]GGB01680.1 LysR family transcriptional regulator [Polaromonas eurypsychrophila]
MKNATLRQLKVFEAVARHLSFSRAAEELHLSQPAVSIQVKKLEDHAGLPLFEQLGKKIHLTPAGVEMLHSSRNIIQQFREAEEAMAQFKGVAGGKLNVAVISAGDYFLPRLLVEFARRHSGVTLDFGVCNREELLSQLGDNLTDLAIMVRPPLGLDTVSEAFAPHPYVVVAAPDHPLASKKRITLSRLAREPFVVREKGSDTWNSMQEGFGAHLADLNIAMEIKSTETIKQAVMAGMGVSFLSAHTISRELQVGSLSVLDVQGFPLMLHWYVVHRRNKRLTPVAQAFKTFLMSDGGVLIEQTIGYRPKEALNKSPAARHQPGLGGLLR